MTTYETDFETYLEPEIYTGRDSSVRLVLDLVEPTPGFRYQPSEELKPPSVATRLSVRFFDIVAGTTALVVATPLMGMVAVAVLATSGGPAIYRSRRYTQGGRDFEIWKFRSMCRDAEGALQRHLDADDALREEYERFHKLEHDPRVTRFGSLLRRTSLDELPQLLNVVRGDMSLVGPRPMVGWERELVGDVALDLFHVKSGVTGAWQVSGRSEISFADRIEMELEYVRSRTFLGDLKIVMQTVTTVMHRSGAR